MRKIAQPSRIDQARRSVDSARATLALERTHRSAATESVLDFSVVCPFYNEAGIIAQAILRMLEQLNALDRRWELIVVNDGSTDNSAHIAEQIAAEYPQLRVLGYAHNHGRGHALRTGIAAARGNLVVTTEIDLSWGERVVEDLVRAMEQSPETDMAVASPHLPGGGYANVPRWRVVLSRASNWLICSLMPGTPTMNTGMTRIYRRAALRDLSLREDSKAFHLEVIFKAAALGKKIREVPAVLDWTKSQRSGRARRSNPWSLLRSVLRHGILCLGAQTTRRRWTLLAATVLVGALALASAQLILTRPAHTLLLLSMSLLFAGSAFVAAALWVSHNFHQEYQALVQSAASPQPLLAPRPILRGASGRSPLAP